MTSNEELIRLQKIVSDTVPDWSRWRHVKSGRLYVVISVAFDADLPDDADLETHVWYVRDGVKWKCRLRSFLEKFERCPAE